MLLLLLAVAWSLSSKARNAILHAINGNGAPDAETGGRKGDGIGGGWSAFCVQRPSKGKGENTESKGNSTQGLPLQHSSPSWHAGTGTSAESTGKGAEVLPLQHTEATSKEQVRKRPAASKEQVKKRPAASADQVKKRPAFSRAALQRRAKRRHDYGCDLDSEESLFLNDSDHVSEEDMEEAEEEIILGTNLMKPGEIDSEPDV